MQRKPKLAKALAQMTAAVWDPEGEVDREIQAHYRARGEPCRRMPLLHGAHGRRCVAFGVDDQKLAAVWEYQTEPALYRGGTATLDFAVAAASVPNEVTDDMFAELRKYWSEGQIVEIVGVIALFGFLNRWNDTMATPLEDEPIAVGNVTSSEAAGPQASIAPDRLCQGACPGRSELSPSPRGDGRARKEIKTARRCVRRPRRRSSRLPAPGAGRAWS